MAVEFINSLSLNVQKFVKEFTDFAARERNKKEVYDH